MANTHRKHAVETYLYREVCRRPMARSETQRRVELEQPITRAADITAQRMADNRLAGIDAFAPSEATPSGRRRPRRSAVI